MTAERHLDWDGAFNARDLGGLRGALGTTRRGALVRSDNLDELSAAGWDAVYAHGIRTVVDLRDPSEHRAHDVLDERPGTVSTPVFDFDDREFWDRWDWHQRDAVPFVPGAFYRGALERWPQRFADAVAAIADAPAGGVLIHCHIGRDRTGLVAALAMALAGIPLDEIAADYALSDHRLEPRFDGWLRAATDETTRAQLERDRSHRAHPEELLGAFAGFDVGAYLAAAGLTEAQVVRLRARLLEPV
jgi:protein tyrosine/serine phosphatase